MVTPSFLVSEPRHAFYLVRWFARNWQVERRMKLVTAWNIHGFLRDLATEKDQQRKNFLRGPRAGVVDQEITANLKGISEKDCTFRHEVWKAVGELLSSTTPETTGALSFMLTRRLTPMTSRAWSTGLAGGRPCDWISSAIST